MDYNRPARRAIDRVYYPGLPSMQDHDLARSQMQNGYSGLISSTVKGSGNNALAFLNALTFPIIAGSFEMTNTLAQHSYLISHIHKKDEQKARSRIITNLISVSVAIENLADLIEDMDRALRVAIRSS